MFAPKAGDLIFYEIPDTFLEMLIEDGEKLADGDPKDARYVYHCGIALDSEHEAEALARVTIDDIHLGNAIVCRPFYRLPQRLQDALSWCRGMEGHLYGWFGLGDQVLRKLSGNHLHLPDWLVTWADNRWPYCSTLLAGVLERAGVVVDVNPPDPQQLYDQFKSRTVYDWRNHS